MAADHYTTLGVPYNATPEEIREAYFRLARILHPDVNPDESVRETFLQIQRAYETLSNAQKKSSYDSTLPAELRVGPALSVNVRTSRTVIPCLSESQLFYALVDIICTAEHNPTALPQNHVCLVLDRSTSMQGPRMDMVKAGALNLLQQLRPQDMLSVISFSDRAEVLVPPTRASLLSKSDHRISFLQTGGGTEILQGLIQGVEQLRRTDTGHLRTLILFTDGHTYGDEEGCRQLARDAAEEGITIHVVGIGHEWNDELMDEITRLSGGTSTFINSPHDLENFLMQKLNDMELLYARGMRFEFENGPDVKLRYAFRLNPNVGPLETDSPMLVGDIQHRKSISFLLEFLVPPLSCEMERLNLARGYVWMEVPAMKVTRQRVLLDIQRPVHSSVEPETSPPVIIEAMSKLTLYRLQERVRLEVEEGQIDKATKHMHYLATHLLSQGDRELAHTVLIEAEHVQQSRRFSGEGEKRIKYGTRALMLPPGPERKT